MYNFIITQSFLKNEKIYKSKANSANNKKYNTFKEKLTKDIFDKSLHTHNIYSRNGIIVYSSYINSKDRLIFLYKKPRTIYLYKVMDSHDYGKLLKNINHVFNDFIVYIKGI